VSKTTNPLRLALNEALGVAGFSRKGDSWYRQNAEILEIVNLQKSQYGNQHYLNYALWLKALGEPAFPKEEKCHIRMRVDDLSSSREQLVRLLDLETDVPELERKAALIILLNSEFLIFAANCRSLADVRALYHAGKFNKAMVLAAAKRVLTDQSNRPPNAA
jgi:hypothetical protein